LTTLSTAFVPYTTLFRSLLCLGMGGWQLWVPPLIMLIASYVLVRAWAGGRIKERKPLAALVGFGLAACAWIILNYGIRAWEIPEDRKSTRLNSSHVKISY